MKNINNIINSTMAILGVNGLALMSGNPKALLVSGLTSVIILLKPQESSRVRLVRNLERQGVNNIDARVIANNIKNLTNDK